MTVETAIIGFCKLLFSSLLFAIFITPFILFLSIFFVYRQIVSILLRIEAGSNFAGLLKGLDVLFSIEGPSNLRHLIEVLLVIKSNKSHDQLYNDFKKVLDKKVFGGDARFKKLRCTLHSKYGYFYLLSDQVSVDDCVVKLKIENDQEEVDRRELMRQLEKYGNVNLAKDHKCMWQLMICDKYVRWTDEKLSHHAVIIRIHHGLADGSWLLIFFREIFLDHKDDYIFEAVRTRNSLLRELLQTIKFAILKIYVLLMIPLNILTRITDKRKWGNFPKPTLMNERLLVATFENNQEGFEMIRNVAKKTNSTVMDILFTATALSLSNYFKEQEEYFEVTSILGGASSMLKLPVLRNVTNSFTFTNFCIPIINYQDIENTKSLELLRLVKKELNRVRNLLDFQVNRILFELFGATLPNMLYLKLLPGTSTAIIITNLPGPSKMTILDGCLIEEFMYWLPHFDTTGLAICFFSYNERFRVGISVDKALISDGEDVATIAENVFNYIKIMDMNSEF